MALVETHAPRPATNMEIATPPDADAGADTDRRRAA
jgi:hypothetical protein